MKIRCSTCAAQLTRRDFISCMLAGALLLPRWPAFALPQAPQFPFEEIPPEKSGIHWVHTSGKSPEKYLPESSGPGCAFLDYDNDGWMDIYLVNSGKCDFFTPNQPLRNALYRNDRDGTFTDVTEKAGVGAGGYGQGVAVGDYNADGWPDLYVTQYGRCILYRNNGDGTFTDVTAKAGVAAPGWASSAGWFEYEHDGWMDLFVANDTVQNFLFANRNGKFEEIALQAGVGFSADGRPRSGMGVDSADFDQDGWMDLFVANVDQEMYALYHNNHDESFDDLAVPSGIGMTTRLMSGWGLKFFDYDNDGNLDLFLTNGHPDDRIETYAGSDVQYRERPLLFHNEGGRLRNVSAEAGPIFARPLSARGLAIGDYDNDGR